MWRILAMVPPMSRGWSECRRLACHACWRYRFVHARNRGWQETEVPRIVPAFVALGVLSTLSLLSPASAQTAAKFYRAKQIRFVAGTAPGQDYDLGARLIGRHITRQIPGNPALIVENMPGAGHIIATNHLYNAAARDGTVIGMVSRNMTDAAVMGLPNVRYDPGRFNWLGSPE